MAITISSDHYHKASKTTSAEPFDAAEVERLQVFKDWVRKTEEEVEDLWWETRPPLAENESLSFAFDESLMPKKYRLVSGTHHWDYCGYIGVAGCPAVSQRFKDVIEGVEPGVHQFVPFELYKKDSSLIEEAFCFWRIRTSLDAINPELGGVKPVSSSPNHNWSVKPGDGREKLAVHKHLTDGRAAWRDVRMITDSFVSDAVVARLKEQGITGWDAMHSWKEI